jgi:hypothetical protein
MNTEPPKEAYFRFSGRNVMSKTFRFWPLDADPEGEIYDNLAWDLPCFRGRTTQRHGRFSQPKPKQRLKPRTASR